LPSNSDVEHQQKLLEMYRALLAEFLRQQKLWDRSDIPDYLLTGIVVIRGHILNIKGTLRSWKILVADHPDDEGPRDDFAREVRHHRELLDIHRANLRTFLKQEELFPAHLAPPMIVQSIELNRTEIQRIKAILRGWNVPVEDLPGEDET
jgi:hypothetical protein